jgi:hypothetical protein
MNNAVQEKTAQVLPFPGQKPFVVDWEELPILLTPKLLLKALPPDSLGRDSIYGLWNIPGFPGLRLGGKGGKLVVGREALRHWLENPRGA